MTPLPAALSGGASELVVWRLDREVYADAWESGEGAFRGGGRWNSRGVRTVYCAIDPATAAVDLYNQGVNAYNSGDMKKALGFFQQSAEKNPEFARVHYMIGMCFVSEGKNADAKAAMEKFIAKAPADDPDLATAKEMMAFLK